MDNLVYLIHWPGYGSYDETITAVAPTIQKARELIRKIALEEKETLHDMTITMWDLETGEYIKSVGLD